jgi:hypothetical protein
VQKKHLHLHVHPYKTPSVHELKDTESAEEALAPHPYKTPSVHELKE